MSYILDALRRADAERERGAVPGLHTQQFGVLPGDEEAPRKSRLLIGTIGLLALALAGVVGWNFFGASEPPPKPVVQAPAMPAPMPMPVAVAPPPPVFAPSPLASAPALALPASAARPVAVARPAPPVRTPARREATPAAATATATAGLPPPGDRIYTQAELPEAIRRELPKLSYGGGSYSGDKASRLAFLNGQVFHEGDTVAPGLVLRQVRPKGAILVYKGYRFELGS